MAEPAGPPVELHVRREGSGPPVLLLHGLGGDHAVWNGVIRPLAQEFDVLAPDLRGHGRSPLPEGSTLNFAELEGDVARLLDQQGLSRVHVVGLSAGGFLALRWTLDRPERVASQIVIGAASHCDAHTRAVGERWAEVYRVDGFDAYVLRLLKDLYAPDWIEAHMEFADRLREELKGRDLRGAVQWGRAVRSFDVRGRIGGIRTPTLVVQGM